MRFQLDNRVMVASFFALISPDALNAFMESLGPTLDVLVRAGQFAVAVATVLYIFKKRNSILTRRTKKKTP